MVLDMSNKSTGKRKMSEIGSVFCFKDSGLLNSAHISTG
jgi:hypothetical protein